MHMVLRNSISVLVGLSKLTGVPDIPTSQVLTLLHIADRGEMPLGDLEKLTGVTQSSVSRNVARLGPGRNPDDPGFGLVDLFEDPYYRRRKLVRLNAKGKQLMARLEGLL